MKYLVRRSFHFSSTNAMGRLVLCANNAHSKSKEMTIVHSMHRADIEHEVHDFVITNFLFGRPLDLQAGDSLLGTGVIDSTGILELIAFLEQRYAIVVSDEEVIPDNLDSIKNIAAYLARKLS